ncbi:MAG: FMN-binding protein [Myxococcales bacterium]|nr:FMN-binding protein [Myxococcales bacterium]
MRPQTVAPSGRDDERREPAAAADGAQRGTEPAANREAAKESGATSMILAMGLIGLISGVLIVASFQLTLPVITKNKAAALERAVFEVLPGAKTKVVYEWKKGGALVPVKHEKSGALYLYAGFDANKKLVGIAIPAEGQGFQDTIKLIYGYSPSCRCVVGLKVLESKETPGLGDKIESDPAFRANFKALKIVLGSDGHSIATPVELAKKGKKEKPYQIEAITGATISSRAITAILKASTTAVVPVIMRNLTVLAKEVR